MAEVSDERLAQLVADAKGDGRPSDWMPMNAEECSAIAIELQARRAAEAKAVEVVEAAKNYVRCADARSGLSPYISENGRRGRSPWSELCDAVAALGARNG